MKKVTLTTEKVLAAYNVISTAKYSKLDDANKVKVWKIARAMKPVADKFADDRDDAAKKLMPTEDFEERRVKAQQYQAMLGDKQADMTQAPMTPTEFWKFIEESNGYNKLLADALNDFGKKEVKVSFEPISEEAFGKLMTSNDWTFEFALKLGEIICGNTEE